MFRTKIRTEEVEVGPATRAGRAREAAAVARYRAAAARQAAAERVVTATGRGGKAAGTGGKATGKAGKAAGKGAKAAVATGGVVAALLGAVRSAFDNQVAPKAGAAAGAVGGAAATARNKAVSGIDHGIDAAVPRGQDAVAGVAPRVDHARDVIVDDLLPRIQELLGNVQSTKDDLLSRQSGAVAAVTGAPKKPQRKGGGLIFLGLLAAVGAAVAYYLSKQQHSPKEDPWAPERQIGGAPGVDSQVRSTLASDEATDRAGTTDVAGTTGTGGTIGSSGTTGVAAGTAAGAAVTGDDATTAGSGADDSWVSAESSRSTGSAEATSSTSGDIGGVDRTDTGASTGDVEVHMLDSQEIDDLAADTPVSAPIDESVVPSGSHHEGGGLLGANDSESESVGDSSDGDRLDDDSRNDRRDDSSTGGATRTGFSADVGSDHADDADADRPSDDLGGRPRP